MFIPLSCMRSLPPLAVLAVLAVLCRPLHAQEWNSEAALGLVRRAIERRAAAHADSGLRRYAVRAEGVVLFLAELGREPVAPRLVKADQVVAEVYWEAPNRSKQQIIAWRERRYLPTDVRYHRDHLGIVTNDFGDLIRLGEGDEVRDVVHPLSGAGLTMYRYALGDTVAITGGETGGQADGRSGGQGEAIVRVVEVMVRPRVPTTPGVVGSLYLDLETARVVRFRFGFTRAAYREAELEDITVELENALFDQRHWLPWRQAIEIRRQSAWLDFPIRTTIRGRWTLGDYEFEAGFPPRIFAGGPYGGLRAPLPDTGWAEPLASVAAREAGSALPGDLEELRRQALRIVGAQAVLPPPGARPSFGSLSELAHVNRVQGLALGLGGSLVPAPYLTIEPTVQVGTADGRLLGRLGAKRRDGRTTLAVEAGREIRDVSDWPVISGTLNSVLAQEWGKDFGDYVLVERAQAWAQLLLGREASLRLGFSVERSQSVEVEAEPSSGRYRSNPALGAGTFGIGRLAIRAGRRRGTTSLQSELKLETGVGLEALAGGGDRDYVRVTYEGTGEAAVRPGTLVFQLRVGAGSRDLPLYRAFPVGGRGTLAGEPFRRFGGRRLLLSRVEWQLPLPLPELRLGSYASTGRTAILAPFFAAGWVGGAVEDSTWQADGGIRPVLGVASELLFRVIRLELGWAIRARRIGFVVDASPAWWPVL